MRLRNLWQVGFAVILLASAGCSTEFSPEWTRHEIERQTGARPGNAFEFKLGGATMKFAQTAASTATGESTGFGGLARIDLAIYELPTSRQLDFDSMPVRGWDRPIRTQEGMFHLLVLVRAGGGKLADLAVFAQGEDKLL